MSRSQYLGFLDCESRQLAKLAGLWQNEQSEAFLVGSYVHAWNEGIRGKFIAETPEMFTQKGELRSNFRVADKMIGALEQDPLAMYMLEGEKEIVCTAEFAGAKWKIKTDVLNRERKRMVELKTTRSIYDKVWSEELRGKVSFIEMYRYLLQAALYCEIERIENGRAEHDWMEYYIVAVSKDNVPDKEVIDLRDPERYIQELDDIKENMPRVLSVKSGEVEPRSCGKCDYCRSVKKLSGSIHYSAI